MPAALMLDELDAVVDKYRDQGLTVAEAIGAIELIKLDIIQGQMDSDEFEGQ